MRMIGLMSGTSSDGIDACLARIEDRGGKLDARIEHWLTVPYPDEVRQRVLCCETVADLCRLNFELGERFADAALQLCEAANVPLDTIDAVGSHGQTVCHIDEGGCHATLQVGEPSVIAERTGLTTVADFRPRDIAAGGRGAPLVPVVDHVLFAHETIDRVALNIGGIANITVLPAGSSVADIVAFDTGPGNMVTDGIVALASGGKAFFDRDGGMAARGLVSEDLLEELLADPYYALPPPKTTGRAEFGTHFATAVLGRARALGLSDVDAIATATALAARTIAAAVNTWGFAGTCEIIASGGGVHNATLMRMIADALPGAVLHTSDEFGVNSDAKEAFAFAVLAYLTLSGRSGNAPAATGARRPVVLGKIVPGRNGI